MNDQESYPEEDMMSQEDQDQEQEEEEEQPKLRILKNKKKKRPVSDKRRKQLAKARATKARKAMERKLMKQHATKKKEEEQKLKHRQVAEDRLADIIEQKVTQAFEQYLGAGSEEESDDSSEVQARALPRKSAPSPAVVDYSFLFQQ